MTNHHVLRTTVDIEAGEATVDIEYTIDPGEPMVRYYRDGSGYPGYPAYIEDATVRLVSIDGVPRNELFGGLLNAIEEELQTLLDEDIENNGILSSQIWENASDN